MKTRRAGYQVVRFPRYLRFSAVMYRSARHKPLMHGLLEVDVTTARAALRAHKVQTGESLSFTAFLAACLGKAVAEHTAVQAFRKGGTRLVLFDDVDIMTRVEHEVDGQKFIVPYIIRAANRKTFRDLHAEIRAAQAADARRALLRYRFMPAVLFAPFIWAFSWIGRMRPSLGKQYFGTVGITSVGMFGTGAGWGIPPVMPTALMVTVGGIGEKQVAVDGRTINREYLSLTISFDHDIVDGAPAARFARRLKELIEGGYGLGDLTAAAMVAPDELATADGAPKQRRAAARAALP